MGTIKSHLDSERDLVVRHVTGAVSGAEIKQSVERYYAGELGDILLHALWDFREASFDQIHAWDIRDIAQILVSHSRTRKGGKTALVFASELGFGLGRMYGISRDLADSGVSVQGFRSMEEALSWLDIEMGSG